MILILKITNSNTENNKADAKQMCLSCLLGKEEYKKMSKEYYTIVRKYYGLPDYLSTDLSDEEDCFAFDTEYEANKCLRDVF